MFRQFIFKFVAEVLFWLHLGWVILLNAALIASVWIIWLRLLVLIGFAITILLQQTNKGHCWITTFENYLRKQCDPDYQPKESFVAAVVQKSFGIRITDRHVVILTYSLAFLSFILFLI